MKSNAMTHGSLAAAVAFLMAGCAGPAEDGSSISIPVTVTGFNEGSEPLQAFLKIFTENETVKAVDGTVQPGESLNLSHEVDGSFNDWVRLEARWEYVWEDRPTGPADFNPTNRMGFVPATCAGGEVTYTSSAYTTAWPEGPVKVRDGLHSTGRESLCEPAESE